jgi:hypothetical protein
MDIPLETTQSLLLSMFSFTEDGHIHVNICLTSPHSCYSIFPALLFLSTIDHNRKVR